MARNRIGVVALAAVLSVGFFAGRARSAQAHGGMRGGMHGMMGGMMKDCPMTKGGMRGGHDGTKQEG